jgi:hypothetical protein
MDSADITLDAKSTEMAGRPAAVSMNGLVLEGPCDVEALAGAIRDVQLDRPELRSRLVDATTLVSKRYAWRPGPPADPPVVDLRDLAHPGPDYDSVVDRIFDRQSTWDLRARPPFGATIALLDDDRTFLSLEVHHAIGDAETNFSCMKAILAGYHLRKVGVAPDWAHLGSLPSTSGTGRAKVASLTTLLRYLRDYTGKYPGARVTHAHGSQGVREDRIAARGIIADPDLQSSIRSSAREHGATMTDLTLAATMRAIAAWNRSQGAEVDVQRAAIAVNQRSAGLTGNNAISGVLAGSLSEDLTDPVALMRGLAEQRIRGLELGIDRRLAAASRKMTTLGSLRPLNVVAERRAASQTSPPATLVLTNVGVVWPEMVDGRPTSRSFLSEAGGLRVADIVMVPNLDTSGALMVIPMTFDGRFQVIIAGNTAKIQQEELRALTDLVIEEIVAYA